MDYGDESIKKVIQDLEKIPSYNFESLYGHIDIIISGLKEVISYRAALRKAVKDEIKTNGMAIIDGSVVNEPLEVKEAKLYYLNDSGDWIEIDGISFSGGKD